MLSDIKDIKYHYKITKFIYLRKMTAQIIVQQLIIQKKYNLMILHK